MKACTFLHALHNTIKIELYATRYYTNSWRCSSLVESGPQTTSAKSDKINLSPGFLVCGSYHLGYHPTPHWSRGRRNSQSSIPMMTKGRHPCVVMQSLIGHPTLRLVTWLKTTKLRLLECVQPPRHEFQETKYSHPQALGVVVMEDTSRVDIHPRPITTGSRVTPIALVAYSYQNEYKLSL